MVQVSVVLLQKDNSLHLNFRVDIAITSMVTIFHGEDLGDAIQRFMNGSKENGTKMVFSASSGVMHLIKRVHW